MKNKFLNTKKNTLGSYYFKKPCFISLKSDSKIERKRYISYLRFI